MGTMDDAAVDEARKAFEVWITANNPKIDLSRCAVLASGQYASAHTYRQWKAWKAACEWCREEMRNGVDALAEVIEAGGGAS